jgi:hypothetical protein
MSYVYEPLMGAANEKAYRILELAAGSGNEPLRGSLIPTALLCEKRAGSEYWIASSFYETVSYTWGKSSDRAHIELDGLSLSVPASACAALRCLRFAKLSRNLWIDSVCINQHDLDERASQVASMGHIYQSSERNLIYLSEGHELAHRALNTVQAIRKATEPARRRAVYGLDSKEHGVVDDVCVDQVAWEWLFSLPWFR